MQTCWADFAANPFSKDILEMSFLPEDVETPITLVIMTTPDLSIPSVPAWVSISPPSLQSISRLLRVLPTVRGVNVTEKSLLRDRWCARVFEEIKPVDEGVGTIVKAIKNWRSQVIDELIGNAVVIVLGALTAFAVDYRGIARFHFREERVILWLTILQSYRLLRLQMLRKLVSGSSWARSTGVRSW